MAADDVMKKVMIFFLLMLVSSSAYSQLQQVTLLDPDKIYVNGLEAYKEYSHQEALDALGTPDKYYLNDVSYYCYYWYDEDGKLIANFCFGPAPSYRWLDYFEFRIPEFSINNLFTVGDHISKIPSTWKKKLKYTLENGTRVFYCSPANWVNTYERQSPLKVYCDERGFITILAMETGY